MRVKDAGPWWIDSKKAVDGIQMQTRHKLHLLEQQNPEQLFPTSSQNVPQKRAHEEYLHFLFPYQHILQSKKTDFLYGDATIGHKVHLNVEPGHVQKVSQYLKQNQFAYKYLSGGEAEDGTIFTIYFGSLLKTKQWCAILAKELQSVLQIPLRSDEIEYAPNISGRFVGSRKDFTQYPLRGIRGFSSLREIVENDPWIKRTPEEFQKHSMEVFQKSYQKLADLYGAFFTVNNS